MMNWPQFLDRADDWAVGFLTGAAATSVIAFAGAVVLLPFAKPSVEGALPEASVDFDGAVRSAAVAVGRPRP